MVEDENFEKSGMIEMGWKERFEMDEWIGL